MNKINHVLGFSAALVLSACGGSGQDEGSPSEVNQTISGLAIDGYVARAVVYIDTNANGSRDPWESYAFTDNDGYFSFNEKTGVDYCAEDATETEEIYCLSTNTSIEGDIIRIVGGYDVLSGQPFTGQLSRRFDDDNPVLNEVIITPLTSLLADINDEADREDILSALDITEDDLDVDYLDTDGAGDIDENLLTVALKIHKSVSIMDDMLKDTYDELGESYGVPTDATPMIYASLAERLEELNSIDEALGSEEVITDILDEVEGDIRDTYTLREIDLPADLGDESNTRAFDRTAEIIGEMDDIIDAVFADEDLDLDEATGAARTLEAVVIKALEEDGIDVTLDNAISFSTNPSNQDSIEDLNEALQEDSADVNALAENTFSASNFDSQEEINSASQLPSDAIPFSLLPGTSLKISDLDLGYGPDQLQDNEVIFYFEGMPSDIEGEFSACVKFIEDGNANTGTISSVSTRGEFIEGSWSLLGGDSSYNLLLTIELLGTTYSGILKPSGSVTIDNVEYQAIRGDADGEFRVWYSELGLSETTEVPTNNQECEAALPSRIGL